jgi:hypothetical protein
MTVERLIRTSCRMPRWRTWLPRPSAWSGPCASPRQQRKSIAPGATVNREERLEELIRDG